MYAEGPGNDISPNVPVDKNDKCRQLSAISGARCFDVLPLAEGRTQLVDYRCEPQNE
jgi:hypothetical protein